MISSENKARKGENASQNIQKNTKETSKSKTFIRLAARSRRETEEEGKQEEEKGDKKNLVHRGLRKTSARLKGDRGKTEKNRTCNDPMVVRDCLKKKRKGKTNAKKKGREERKERKREKGLTKQLKGKEKGAASCCYS